MPTVSVHVVRTGVPGVSCSGSDVQSPGWKAISHHFSHSASWLRSRCSWVWSSGQVTTLYAAVIRKETSLGCQGVRKVIDVNEEQAGSEPDAPLWYTRLDADKLGTGTADHRCLPSVIQEVRDPSADFPLAAVLVELVDQESMINLTEGLSKVHNEGVCLLSMC